MSTPVDVQTQENRSYLQNQIEGSIPEEEKDSAALRRERDRWRRLFYQLFEGLPEPSFIHAPDEGIVETNRAAEDVYGIPVGEIVGMEPEAVFDTERETSEGASSNGHFPTTTAIETGDSVQSDSLRRTATTSGDVTHRSAAIALSTPDEVLLGAVGFTPVVTDLDGSQDWIESIRNHLTGELPFLTERLEEDFDEIVDHLTSTAETTKEQRDRMENVSSEIGDLSASIEEVAATAEEVASESQRTRDLATESREEADDVVAIMDEVQSAGDEMVDEVQSLDTTLEEIDAVVDTIDDIADRTNILALNASIEAARAGEAGSGFSVVAEEVKSLAEQVSQQATEIESMIDDVQRTSADTIHTIGATYDGLADGIDRIGTVTDRLETIADAAEESAQGVTEVSRATDDQAASTEEVAAVVEGLVATSKTLTAETSIAADASQYQRELIEEIAEEITAVEKLTTEIGHPTADAE